VGFPSLSAFCVCTKRFTNISYSSLKRFAHDNIADLSGEWLCDSMTALVEKSQGDFSAAADAGAFPIRNALTKKEVV
jgi:hypothetical protein